MNNAEMFCQLNGIQWHIHKYKRKLPYWLCSCRKTGCSVKNPTFTDAKSILEVMEKRDDFGDFLIQRVGKLQVIESNKIYAYVEIYYVYNPDKLLDKAIEWCEK